MPPQKAKLHTKTGKLKSINKAYSFPTNASSNASTVNTGPGMGRSTASIIRPTIASNTTNTSIQTDVQPSTSATTSNATALVTNAGHDTEVDQQFELELCWCIQSMENSLNSGKLSAKQGT